VRRASSGPTAKCQALLIKAAAPASDPKMRDASPCPPDRSPSPEQPPRPRLFYVRMKCPKCKAAVTSAPDASGLIICPKCGAGCAAGRAPKKRRHLRESPRTGSETVAVRRHLASRFRDAARGRPGAYGDAPAGESDACGSAGRRRLDDKVTAISSSRPKSTPVTVPPAGRPRGLESLFDELRAIRLVRTRSSPC